MATPLSPADIGGLLQHAYANDPKIPALFSKFPFYDMLSKVGMTGGDSFNMTCVYQASVRVGSTPGSIYGLTQLAPAAQFQLLPKRQYGYSAIDGLAMVQAGQGMEKKALASFINVCHSENISLTKTMIKLHALYATRGGTGSLGTVDPTTTLGSTVLVLARVSDQYNFEEGQVIQVAATDGAAPRAGTLTIASIPANGTLVMTTTLTAGVAAIASGDFIVLTGEGQTSTFPGLQSWCPLVSGTKGTFANVNRDLAPRKLAGFFVDGSAEGLTIDAAIAAGLNRFKANEGGPSHCFLNPYDFEALAQTGATNVIVDQGIDREFGFKSLSFVSDGSKVRVYEDCTFQQGTAWLIDMSSIEMRFVAKPEPTIDDRDGLTLRKLPSGVDSWEMTFSDYPYGICIKDGMAPGRVLCGIKLY